MRAVRKNMELDKHGEVNIDALLRKVTGCHLPMSGKTMRRLRHEIGDALGVEFGQRELSYVLHHARPTISRFETGHHDIGHQTATLLRLVHDLLTRDPYGEIERLQRRVMELEDALGVRTSEHGESVALEDVL